MTIIKLSLIALDWAVENENSYFFFLETTFFLGRDVALATGVCHSSLSEINSPPSPTTIKIKGQKFQNIAGKYPILEAKKIKPMINNVAGQNTLLGIYILLFCYKNKYKGYFITAQAEMNQKSK